MKYEELLKEAREELDEEYRTMAKEEVKCRLREIQETKKLLTRMEKSLEKLLEREVE